MARGATNAEIAAALFVAEATVKTHVGSIFGKLGVRDRAAAIVFAYDHGVVTPGVTPRVAPPPTRSESNSGPPADAASRHRRRSTGPAHGPAAEWREAHVIEGVSKVVIEVDDQDARSRGSGRETLGFELYQDTPYGDERWVEVRAPDRRSGPRPQPSSGRSAERARRAADVERLLLLRRPPATYDELRARGVEFPQPPVELSFGWWSMFEDQEGNRFALHPARRARMTERLARGEQPAALARRRSLADRHPRRVRSGGDVPRVRGRGRDHEDDRVEAGRPDPRRGLSSGGRDREVDHGGRRRASRRRRRSIGCDARASRRARG